MTKRPPYLQHDRFGDSQLTWPDRMSEGELEDFNAWLDLCKRKINRISSQPMESAETVQLRLVVERCEALIETMRSGDDRQLPKHLVIDYLERALSRPSSEDER